MWIISKDAINFSNKNKVYCLKKNLKNQNRTDTLNINSTSNQHLFQFIICAGNMNRQSKQIKASRGVTLSYQKVVLSYRIWIFKLQSVPTLFNLFDSRIKLSFILSLQQMLLF